METFAVNVARRAAARLRRGLKLYCAAMLPLLCAYAAAATPAVHADFKNAAARSYANNEAISGGGSVDDQLTVRISAADSQGVAVVDAGGGKRALQFTDNSTDNGGPRVFKALPGLSTGASGDNEVIISFDLTPLVVKGQRPSLQILLNSRGSETPSGSISALHMRISDSGDKASVGCFDGGSSTGGALLTPGTSYRFSIVVNLSSAAQDLYSIRVAPTADLSHPVMDLSDLGTRAANVAPNILVFDGGADAPKANAAPFVQIENLTVTAATHANPTAAAAPAGTLWQIGFDDSSLAEFSAPGAAAYTVPADWKGRQDWTAFPRQISRAVRPTLDLNYSLAAVPQHGVEFSFRTLQTSYATPELAVYSNGQFAGMIQTRGTKLKVPCYGDFREVYQLYIPPEKLQAGQNVLRLEVPLMPFTTSAEGDALSVIGWDYLRLRALSAPAMEPIHGRVVYAGTCFMQNATQPLSGDMVRCVPPLAEWLGIAYSGNTIRANFWKNRTPDQPVRMELLQKYRELNMDVVMDYMSGFHVRSLDKDGSLAAADKAALKEFVAAYGSLFQYYEISNEPCGIGNEALDKEIAIARYLREIRPSHLKIAAPGYTFTTKGGTPNGWEGDPAYRAQLEQYCDLLGGHSYGTGFGAFQNNLNLYGPTVNDGFPKEFILTECGSIQSHHVDLPKTGATQQHAAAFDRNMRNLIAVADRFIQHAPFFLEGKSDYNLFVPVEKWETVDPLEVKAYPGAENEESRLKTYRRLALAYSTHGQPLKYEVLNAAKLQYKRVYVRPVNTAALPPLPGSGATSDKVLLNFVNFEPDSQVVQARIYLPAKGNWSGRRIGAGNVLREARSDVSLAATPYVDITEKLDGHESVQYILAPAGAR